MGEITKIVMGEHNGEWMVAEICGSLSVEEAEGFIRFDADALPNPVSPPEVRKPAMLDVNAANLSAARGAAIILCGELGIDHEDGFPVHTLVKRCVGRARELMQFGQAMRFELKNLAGAMTRFGFQGVPGGPNCEWDTNTCQTLGHFLDVEKRAGWKLYPPSPGSTKREEIMAHLGMLQKMAQFAMVDAAMIDGAIDESTPPEEIQARVMQWSMLEDEKRKRAKVADDSKGVEHHPKPPGAKEVTIEIKLDGPGTSTQDVDDQFRADLADEVKDAGRE